MRHTDTPRRSCRILRSLVGTATVVAIAATASASPAAAAEPWLKPVLGGLLDRHNPPPSGFRGTVDGFVAEVAWADLRAASWRTTPSAPLTRGPCTTSRTPLLTYNNQLNSIANSQSFATTLS